MSYREPKVEWSRRELCRQAPPYAIASAGIIIPQVAHVDRDRPFFVLAYRNGNAQKMTSLFVRYAFQRIRLRSPTTSLATGSTSGLVADVAVVPTIAPLRRYGLRYPASANGRHKGLSR